MSRYMKYVVVILVLLIVLGFGVLKIRSDYLNRQFQEELTTLNLSVIENVKTIDAIGENSETNVIFFSQSDENSVLHQRIMFYTEKLSDSQANFLEKEWRIIYPAHSETSLVNVDAYDLIERRYVSEFLTVNLDSEKTLETFYAKQDGSQLTLDDLIADKEAFRKTLTDILSQNSELQAKEVHEKLLETFDSDDWSTIPFSYEDKTLFLGNATISMSVFVDSLNSEFFTAEDMAYFREME